MKTLLLLILAPLCALAQSSGSIVNWVIVTSNSALGPSRSSSVGDTCANYNTGYVNSLTGDQIICKNPTPLVSAGTYAISNNGSGVTPTLNALLDPTGSKAFAMSGFSLSFTYGAATSSANLFTVQDTASNTGTGYVLTAGTAAGSAANPFRVMCGGAQCFSVNNSSGALLLENGNSIVGSTFGMGLSSTIFGADASGSGKDNQNDLGLSSVRWHTLYLGGIANVGEVQGIGSVPGVTATGTGCSNPTVNTGSNNVAGAITATGTGATCTIVFTWSGSLAFSHAGNVALQDNTTRTNIITQSGATTTTTTLIGPMTSGDVLSYTVAGY